MDSLHLDGSSLTIADLVRAAQSSPEITLDVDGTQRMANSRTIIEEAIEQEKPVYGVNRGLGGKAVESLNKNELADFSKKTLRGRAHTIGEETSVPIVRAAMIVRANTLLTGHSGARPKVAEHLVACLNANITPITNSIGSIGVADLLPNSNLGLSLIGEGVMREGISGNAIPSLELMEKHGIEPLMLEARDGLALASHSSYVSGHAAITLNNALRALAACQSSAALSMEAFRANLSALDERALALRPLPGQMAAAFDLRERLKGSLLFDYSSARRIQDPISIRNIPQIHGTVWSAVNFAIDTINIEINGVSDNPVVLTDAKEIISCGLYFTSEICNAVDTVSRSFVHLAAAQLSRTAKHLDAQLTDLPAYLTRDGSSSAGLAPVMKVQESLFSELVQAAQPVMVWPSASGNGVEDCVAATPSAVKALAKVAKLSLQMSAVEMIVACQAYELRDPQPESGPFVGSLVSEIQKHSPQLRQDRPLSSDIEQVLDNILDQEPVFYGTGF